MSLETILAADRAARREMRWLWTKDAIAGAIFAGIVVGLATALPLIAPYGIRDLFHSAGQPSHQPWSPKP